MDHEVRQPLHARVAAALRAEVDDHAAPPGTLLPSESALTERFGVSRSVVRQALAALEGEGRVRREKGRGTVVVDRADHRRLVQRAGGLHDQLATGGAVVTTHVLEAVVEPAPEVARWLGADEVLRLERVRSVDGRAVARIRTHLPLPLLAGLRAEDLEDASLHAAMEALVGVRPRRGSRQVRAVAADEGLAAQLGVRAGDPLLLLEGRGAADDGTPLEVFATWHRGDAVSFELDVDDVRARPLAAADAGHGHASGSASTASSTTTTSPEGRAVDAQGLLADLDDVRDRLAVLLARSGPATGPSDDDLMSRIERRVEASGVAISVDELLAARDQERR
ncbi:GntR family transcriptional regulator [Pseudokineococcus marinus]|uniref:GntR family transcriptional regulator n=1 Tax=Pseudokineococcus marinus TaxID=351215 RepID=A0A849BIC5_9ACTN|nr:GntR family transcriptional regulator [Pseudokineococcus marinus]NNH22930.1 GntR family transcriptional regulator [Pseudokineococcus marinus]